jgi:hypothetical protein
MISRLFKESPDTTAEGSKKVGGPIRNLALPFVGLALGALPGAAYGALVALVHLVVSGRWDQAPALAAGAARCAAVTAAIGLTVGIWLAISRVRQTRLRTVNVAFPFQRGSAAPVRSRTVSGASEPLFGTPNRGQ